MAAITSRRRNLLLAGLVPFVVQTILLVLWECFRTSLPWLGNLTSLAISTLAGFVFVVREYRWYALIVGLAYLPAIGLVLFGYSLVFVGAVFGDWI